MPNRTLLNLSMTTLLGAALLQSPWLHAEELPPAIKKIEAKGAKIVGSFDAPSGLRGGGDAGAVDADVDDGSWFMAVGGQRPQAVGSGATSRRNGHPLAAGYRTVRARHRGRP